MTKRIIAVFLAIALFIPVFGTVSFAEQKSEWASIDFARYFKTKHIKSYGFADINYDNFIRSEKLGREWLMLTINLSSQTRTALK